MANSYKDVRNDLNKLASSKIAAGSQRFFKTNPGEYGEGDVFIGVRVPDQRKVAAKYSNLGLVELHELITSNVHEERLTALFILVNNFKKADQNNKKLIYNFYISHLDNINNWDLVDSSASYIVGGWLADKDKSILIDLANSKVLWRRRIAMLSTLYYISEGDSVWALKIASILLEDSHDLIQKAVGWMLREVGKKCSLSIEQEFIINNYARMPRTTLRYAIERFPDKQRLDFLKGTF